ncbi:glycerate kinase [Leucobacter manosquensis]|uniref:Glycerate kinase n=1 Tax=Leucobacter manosquensis TaxID=2810611 RepID=A0ABS5M0I1_9MICO|nr:glycerate kinase [Leucobacter manosquensis]MBS3180702.1 glycerate kinase [Leucobacter manosquensis]
MRIVVAPDKFKNALDARSVGDALADGIRSVEADADISVVPMADGGEGTLDAAIAAGFAVSRVTVTGPLGAPVDAEFAQHATTAVIELARASGLSLVAPGHRDALGASSRGTGELIAAALAHGATSIILAVGGSASSDGGAGMLAALGARLLDAQGEPLPDGGGALRDLERIELDTLDPRLADTRFVLASDVDHVLLGPQGAASVFAPQKGASVAHVAQLELGLTRFARILRAELERRAPRDRVKDFAQHAGAGAAGGVGFAALAVLRALQRPGVDVVCELTRLRAHLAGADLVITGEGSLDAQSLGGKTPVGVLHAAATLGIPTVAVCGQSSLEESEWRAAGFSACYATIDRAPDRATSIRNARVYLTEIGAEIAAAVAARRD